jgi:uncharacterized protein (DUF302 family)
LVLTTTSQHDHAETVSRLLAGVHSRGIAVFARIDHAAAAREVGLELQDEQVIVFGNPKAGTPLMQDDPAIGLELPLRVLVWRSGDEVKLAYNDPIELGDRYDVAAHATTLQAMSALIGELVAHAAGSTEI